MSEFLRFQRYRQTPAIRRLVSETALLPQHFIAPLFIQEDLSGAVPISSLPGQSRFGLDAVCDEVRSLVDLGIQAVILFGIPSSKDAQGTASYDENGIIQQAIRLLKATFPDLVVMADLCLCEYTNHGHCGILDESGCLQNDATLPVLAKIAQSYAAAGVDVVAQSGMMDGAVMAIRQGLDRAGHQNVMILAYAIKYASQFYGPFRDAAGSGDEFVGDRKHHQLAPSQRREALRDGLADEQEGADMLMVKPAMPYLDMVRDLRERTGLPVVAYQVSGEFAMLKQAVVSGIIDDERACFEEALIGMRRAGADLIISYYAKEFLSNVY